MDTEHLGSFAREYSDRRFLKKLKNYGRNAGREVLDKAFRLYYVLKKPETPKWAKGTIIGALGYFIFPFDAMSDLLPFIGYSDDLSVLVAALATVASYVDEGVKEQARLAADRLLGAELEDKTVDEASVILDIEADDKGAGGI